MPLQKVAIVFALSLLFFACPKKETAQERPTAESPSTGAASAAEADCRIVCTKSPRLHFEYELNRQLKLRPTKEHAEERAKAEKQWKEHLSKMTRQVEGCIKGCMKNADPKVIGCLKNAKDFEAMKACRETSPPAKSK